MSIINKMHKDFQLVHGEAPILAPMPTKNKAKKIIIMALSALLLSSSLGLSYLIFLKNNKLDSEGLLTPKVLSSLSRPIKSEINHGSIVKLSSELNIDNIVADGVIVEKNVAEKSDVGTEINTVEAVPVSDNISVGVTFASPVLATQEAIQRSAQQPIQQQPIQQQLIQEQPIQTAQVAGLLTSEKKIPVKTSTINTAKQVNATKQGSHLKITSVQLSDSELANIYIKEAQKAKQEGDNDLAAEKWQKALALQPQLNEVRQSLAMYYYAQGDVNKSINLLTKGVIASPNFSDFRLMLSRIATKEGDLQKAFLYLDQNPPVVQGHLDYHVSYAILAQKFGYFDKSEELYSNLLINRPKDGRWRMSLAIAQDKQGKTKQAVSNYQKALLETSLSSNAKAYINQRLSYLKTNSGIL